MDFWDSHSVTQSFKQQCQHLFGDFFCNLENSAPWFLSVGKPVNGVQGTCLTYHLGFDHEKGISFLCSMGLIREVRSRLPNAIVVVTAAWDRFIEKELLGDIMETITKKSVSRIAYYFIHYGKKSLLSHRPIDQFEGKILKPTKGISNLLKHQQRFHKKLSHLDNKSSFNNHACH